jgi:Nitrile hydratase, alpha chain
MSEESGRAEVERRLVERSLQDEDFRRRLLEDPRATVEEELGTRLPEGVQVRAVEETAETIYLVLPSASPIGEEGGELSDRELETVSGGELAYTWDPNVAGCAGEKACSASSRPLEEHLAGPTIPSRPHASPGGVRAGRQGRKLGANGGVASAPGSLRRSVRLL